MENCSLSTKNCNMVKNLMEIQKKGSKDVRTLKNHIKAALGGDTERLSSNVSVKMIKLRHKVLPEQISQNGIQIK